MVGGVDQTGAFSPLCSSLSGLPGQPLSPRGSELQLSLSSDSLGSAVRTAPVKTSSYDWQGEVI